MCRLVLEITAVLGVRTGLCSGCAWLSLIAFALWWERCRSKSSVSMETDSTTPLCSFALRCYLVTPRECALVDPINTESRGGFSCFIIITRGSSVSARQQGEVYVCLFGAHICNSSLKAASRCWPGGRVFISRTIMAKTADQVLIEDIA